MLSSDPRNLLQRGLWASALLVAALPCNAETLTVGSPGSGADFTSLSDAINASNDGDTIRIDAGSFTYNAPVAPIDESLRIVGAGEFQTFISNLSLAGNPLVIEGLAADQSVEIVGMEFALIGLTDFDPFVVRNNEGSVLFSNVRLISSSTTTSQVVAVENCAAVVVHDALVIGSPRAETIRCSDSLLAVSQSLISSANGFASNLASGPTLLAQSSAVFVTDTEIRGANGGNQSALAQIDADGMPAAKLQSSIMFLRGDNLLTGGDAGMENGSGARGGSAVELNLGSSLFVDTAATLTGGAGEFVQAPAIEAAPGANVQFEQDRGLTLRLDEVIASSGTTVSAQLTGEPGLFGAYFITEGLAAPTIPPGVFGVLLIDLPAMSSQLITFTLDGAGTLDIDLSIPAATAESITTLGLQAAEINAFGAATMSNPVFAHFVTE